MPKFKEALWPPPPGSLRPWMSSRCPKRALATAKNLMSNKFLTILTRHFELGTIPWTIVSSVLTHTLYKNMHSSWYEQQVAKASTRHGQKPDEQQISDDSDPTFRARDNTMNYCIICINNPNTNIHLFNQHSYSLTLLWDDNTDLNGLWLRTCLYLERLDHIYNWTEFEQ